MVCGCMLAAGIRNSMFLNDIMLKEDYKCILTENLLQAAQKLRIKCDAIFKHDSDMKHTAAIITSFLVKKCIETMLWVGQSPSMNLNEHLWSE